MPHLVAQPSGQRGTDGVARIDEVTVNRKWPKVISQVYITDEHKYEGTKTGGTTSCNEVFDLRALWHSNSIGQVYVQENGYKYDGSTQYVVARDCYI